MTENQITKQPGLVWTPVRTKPRQEKKLAEYCKAHGFTYYLPLKKNVKRYQRRTVEFTVPMFPGYIFCLLNEDIYRTMLHSGAIVYRITMDENKEKRLIDDLNDLMVFEEMIKQQEVIIRPEIVEGAKIKVRSGPLQGAAGIVEKRKDQTLLTINIEILGQAVSTIIDIGDIELDD